MDNSAQTVVSILSALTRAGFSTCVFGGWAEEALQIAAPRSHSDIDLLLVAPSWESLERGNPFRALGFNEIAAKRFPHKRAFGRSDVMVELILVQSNGAALETLFWGDTAYRWSSPLCKDGILAGEAVRCASVENLFRYRDEHRSTQPWRWKSFAPDVAD